MQTYLVGGAVRDEILGVKSKDLDYVVVLNSNEPIVCGFSREPKDPFDKLVYRLERDGFKVFDQNRKFFTVRAKFPKGDHRYPMVGDFVLARKEADYSDGRHPDTVEVGTLGDDLKRRDFTMNAIAKEANGNLIDPHGGQLDIKRRLVRAVGDPFERLSEDPLRALRAIRFAVTKGFNIDPNLRAAMHEPAVVEGVASSKVADERIDAELSKAFRADTVASLLILSDFPALMSAAFSGKVSLDSTMKQKGRGK